LRNDLVGLRALLFNLQIGPLQQRRQRGGRRQAALHARGGAVGHGLRVEGQAHTRLAGKTVQRRCQRASRDVPLLQLQGVISASRLCQRWQCRAADNQTQNRSVHGTAEGVALWNRCRTHFLAP
jgi:hypothetical protein